MLATPRIARRRLCFEGEGAVGDHIMIGSSSFGVSTCLRIDRYYVWFVRSLGDCLHARPYLATGRDTEESCQLQGHGCLVLSRLVYGVWFTCSGGPMIDPPKTGEGSSTDRASAG
jgi:hypothetical protein